MVISYSDCATCVQKYKFKKKIVSPFHATYYNILVKVTVFKNAL